MVSTPPSIGLWHRLEEPPSVKRATQSNFCLPLLQAPLNSSPSYLESKSSQNGHHSRLKFEQSMPSKQLAITIREGPGVFPDFSDKLTDRNINNSRHLFGCSKGLMQLQWETGLRSYKPGTRKLSLLWFTYKYNSALIDSLNFSELCTILLNWNVLAQIETDRKF